MKLNSLMVFIFFLIAIDIVIDIAIVLAIEPAIAPNASPVRYRSGEAISLYA